MLTPPFARIHRATLFIGQQTQRASFSQLQGVKVGLRGAGLLVLTGVLTMSRLVEIRTMRQEFQEFGERSWTQCEPAQARGRNANPHSKVRIQPMALVLGGWCRLGTHLKSREICPGLLEIPRRRKIPPYWFLLVSFESCINNTNHLTRTKTSRTN